MQEGRDAQQGQDASAVKPFESGDPKLCLGGGGGGFGCYALASTVGGRAKASLAFQLWLATMPPEAVYASIACVSIYI